MSYNSKSFLPELVPVDPSKNSGGASHKRSSSKSPNAQSNKSRKSKLSNQKKKTSKKTISQVSYIGQDVKSDSCDSINIQIQQSTKKPDGGKRQKLQSAVVRNTQQFKMPSRREKQSQNTQVSIQSKVMRMEHDILVEEMKLEKQKELSKEKMRNLVKNESINSFKE